MKINYAALAAAIAIGVFAGQSLYGLGKFAWTRYEHKQLSIQLEQEQLEQKARSDAQHQERLIKARQQELRQAEEQQQREMQDQLRRETGQQLSQARTEQMRRDSSTGKKLLSDCRQWQLQLETMRTATVEEMARTSCERYERYLQTGR